MNNEKGVLGPVIVRRSIREIEGVWGRFFLDFRPEFHLGEHGWREADSLFLASVSSKSFRESWEARGRDRFGAVSPPRYLPQTESWRSESALLPSRALVLKILGEITLESDDLIEEMAFIFSRRLKDMFPALAYRAATLGERRFLIARHERFEPAVQQEIYRRIPFDVYRGGEVLRDLYIEMVGLVRFRGVTGAWGQVHEKEGEIWIDVADALPEFENI